MHLPVVLLQAVGGHRRYCDSGLWACKWCETKNPGSSGKGEGPDGPKTLCGSCNTRYKAGHIGAPKQNDKGQFVCDDCAMTFETTRGLGSHRRGCTGSWKCNWCNCEEKKDETPDGKPIEGKATGPDGKKTLCTPCGARYRLSVTATTPPKPHALPPSTRLSSVHRFWLRVHSPRMMLSTVPRGCHRRTAF